MTIKEVAEYSGVSVSTVSRVLNNRPDVSEKVRERVLDAVQTLHFVPNNAARDLVRTQSNVIGVVMRGMENPFFTPVTCAIEETASSYNYGTVTHHIRSGDDEILAGAALARSKRLRGLIFLGGCFDYTPEQVAAVDVPFVCCTYTNSFGTLLESSYASVSIDDQVEAFRATSMLLQQGHRRIAVLLDSTSDRSISQLRYAGYCEALQQAGIAVSPDLVAETVDFTMAAAYTRTARLLQSGASFTAIFAIADSMAIAAMKALSDAGRRVPEDCSVVAIDGIDMSLYTVPTLTTLVQPKTAIGEKSVEILLGMIDGGAQVQHVRVETTLRPGGTVAGPKNI